MNLTRERAILNYCDYLKLGKFVSEKFVYAIGAALVDTEVTV